MNELLNVKQLLALIVFAGCTEGYSQNSLNALQTTVPFLNIVTNARIGAYGEIDAVSSSFYKEAGLAQNPALLSGNPRYLGVNYSYMPWLSNLAEGYYLFDNNLYYSVNNTNAIGYRFNYFHIPARIYRSSSGGIIENKGHELFHQLTYSHAFSEQLSAGAGAKYISSDIIEGTTQNGYNYKPATVFAMDLGIHYATGVTFSENLFIHINTGAAINNLGNRMKYTDDPEDEGQFLPSCLRIGLMVNPEWYVSDDITFSFDMAYQMEKLLVPSPPIYSLDENGDPYVLYGKEIPESVPMSWIQSFYDAPDGFKEEMHEIIHKIGTEVRFVDQDKLYFAIRAGRFMEHATKGNRKYITAGIGIGVLGFTLDTRMILAPSYSPLDNTWAITVGYNAHLGGPLFRF